MKDVYADETLEISQEDFLRPENLGADTLNCKDKVSVRGHDIESDGFDEDDLFE